MRRQVAIFIVLFIQQRFAFFDNRNDIMKGGGLIKRAKRSKEAV